MPTLSIQRCWLLLGLAGFLGLTGGLVPAMPVEAVTIRVTSLADPGSGGCTVAECTLSEAITAAQAGDTIRFAEALFASGRRTIRLNQGQLRIAEEGNRTVNSFPGTEDCNGLLGVLLRSRGHNLVGTDTGCPVVPRLGDVTVNPATVFTRVLGPLRDNGGPTLTHALRPGSPALDAGDTARCPATDQRGVSRPQGSGCDIGAFELEVP